MGEVGWKVGQRVRESNGAGVNARGDCTSRLPAVPPQPPTLIIIAAAAHLSTHQRVQLLIVESDMLLTDAAYRSAWHCTAELLL